MKNLRVGVIGNPNCGKSTLFNALTGSKQSIGNWPGVTVERKSGFFNFVDYHIELIDLPGVYTLLGAQQTQAIDAKIACQFLSEQEFELIINVVDATNLERNLFLTTQLLSMNVPKIVVVNMIDIAHQRGNRIDLDQLSQQLGCPVVGCVASKGDGIRALKEMVVSHARSNTLSHSAFRMPQEIIEKVNALHDTDELKNLKKWQILHLLESGNSPCLVNNVSAQNREDADVIIAGARFDFAHQVVARVLSQSSKQRQHITSKIDRFVLNRVLGIPIFLAVMYCMFLFTIHVGGIFQDFFDLGSDALFVQGLSHWLLSIGSPHWLIAVVAQGAGKGVNTVLTFIPILFAMFFFLSVLEGSGYMARAAIVMDKLMRKLGLPGKAFVPLLVGFGCNVPAVMAARTLENPRDRIVTIMMTPFMSCSARLAIFVVFVNAFFVNHAEDIIFGLYLTGILVAIFTGFILRKTILKGDNSPLIMELPPLSYADLTKYNVADLVAIKILYYAGWEINCSDLYCVGGVE